MDLPKLRDSHKEKPPEYEQRLKHLNESDTRHFRKEGNGPLSDITEEIKAEYHRHIHTCTAIIAETDAIFGV